MQAMDNCRELKAHLDHNIGTVADYKEKFEKLKVIVHSKEIANSDLRAKLATAEETLKSKDAKVSKL